MEGEESRLKLSHHCLWRERGVWKGGEGEGGVERGGDGSGERRIAGKQV